MPRSRPFQLYQTTNRFQARDPNKSKEMRKWPAKSRGDAPPRTESQTRRGNAALVAPTAPRKPDRIRRIKSRTGQWLRGGGSRGRGLTGRLRARLAGFGSDPARASLVERNGNREETREEGEEREERRSFYSLIGGDDLFRSGCV
jgi:hypothetical protein